MVTPLPSQRDLFDIPDDVAYLNAAYMGPLPRPVVEAGEAGLRAKVQPWRMTSQDFFTGSERFRVSAARLIHGDPDGIAIVPAVSYGVAVAARNLPLPPGRRVVVLQDEFPSDVYAWRALDVPLDIVPRPEDGDWTRALLDRIDEGVGLVGAPNVHWMDGGLVDLERVGEAARAAGALLVVDVTQSLGAMPLDVARVQPDVVLCALYKWLLGPYSVAFAWFAPQHRGGAGIEASWLSRVGAEDFTTLRLTDELQEGARRYDVGERANFALLPAATVAADLLAGWGADAVGATIERLNARIEDGVRDLEVVVPPRALRGPHMLGIRLPGGAPRDLAARLAAAGVFVSVRGDAVRVSPHVYNVPADVDRLLEVLAEAVPGAG